MDDEQWARRDIADSEFAGIPTLHKHALIRGGYWTRAQVIADLEAGRMLRAVGAKGHAVIRDCLLSQVRCSCCAGTGWRTGMR